MALLNCFAELVQNKFLLDCICLFGGGGREGEWGRERAKAFILREKGGE